MNNFTFTQNDCKEETTSTWLIAVMQFGLKINLFKPFEGLKLKIKKVKYSVYQKLITTMMSIVIGCETTKDINEKLGVEKLALNMFDMDTVPDQSQINELIRRFDNDSVNQLQDIHHNLFMEHSNSVYSHTQVVVDCDQTGLIANGKTFELAEKGYFAKKSYYLFSFYYLIALYNVILLLWIDYYLVTSIFMYNSLQPFYNYKTH